VGGVHDFLTPEIPEAYFYFNIIFIDFPGIDVNAVGLGFVFIEGLSAQLFDQRGFSSGAVTY
jgi:hypothetical protein